MQNNSKTVSILLLQIFLLSLIFIPIIFTFTKIFGQSEISSTNKLPQFNIKWGSYGTGNGQFISPSGIAVDSSDNVYVVDAGNNRIQKFTNNGTFITTWGSYGTGNGQFNSAIDMDVDSSDKVYITNSNTGSGSNPVQKFTNNGTFITTWGYEGSGNGQFISPSGIAVDSSNNVYVSDLDDNNVQKFTSNGTFITTWGSYGTGNGQFISPSGIAVDSSNNVYVVDAGNNRIEIFVS